MKEHWSIQVPISNQNKKVKISYGYEIINKRSNLIFFSKWLHYLPIT